MNRRSQGFVALGGGLVAVCLLLPLLLAPTTEAATESQTQSPSGSSQHKSSSSSSSTATQARQSPLSAAAGVLGALSSLVPGLVSNVAPLVLLLGLGAMMMPSLGLSALGLLRESRRR